MTTISTGGPRHRLRPRVAARSPATAFGALLPPGAATACANETHGIKGEERTFPLPGDGGTLTLDAPDTGPARSV
ncbi:hypothetical protein [Streptomyces aidingensis]|uniref:Uncharacterized protein n=1 Tax=Streptomyces aidingensis TaxID=910347 RepID=A0A1I1SKJ3_9ACTN|nr:hypothetical protein [Streptomyces aidingensis]SFD46999.1 hypothetical protein SAMN05421773_11674 [Streptomyces aidingensis]